MLFIMCTVSKDFNGNKMSLKCPTNQCLEETLAFRKFPKVSDVVKTHIKYLL
jgi:hypothetical protein